MKAPKVLQFGTITEKDGKLHIENFNIEGDGGSNAEIILKAIISRLQDELAKEMIGNAVSDAFPPESQ